MTAQQTDNRAAGNSGFASGVLTCKLGALCFYSSVERVDCFVVRNPTELKARNSYKQAEGKNNDRMTMKFLPHKDKEQNIANPTLQKQKCSCPALYPSFHNHTLAFLLIVTLNVVYDNYIKFKNTISTI